MNVKTEAVRKGPIYASYATGLSTVNENGAGSSSGREIVFGGQKIIRIKSYLHGRRHAVNYSKWFGSATNIYNQFMDYGELFGGSETAVSPNATAPAKEAKCINAQKDSEKPEIDCV